MEFQFYVHPDELYQDTKVILSGSEFNHITKSLRFNEGDRILLADGRGNDYLCEITALSKKSLEAKIIKKRSYAEPKHKIVLAQALIKKRDRLEFAIEKAVELGVSEIVLFNSAHSERTNAKTKRLEQIVLSAFKQSHRKWLPEIRFYTSLHALLQEEAELYQDPLSLHVAHFGTYPLPDKEFFKDKNSWVFIGPEGGFSEDEIMLLDDAGASFYSLGPNRLRAETATIAFLSRLIP